MMTETVAAFPISRRAARTLFLFAVITVSLGANSTLAHAQSLEVGWTNERLTIVAADVPTAQVLTEVIRQTGSSVVGLERVSGSVTIDVREAMLFDALRTLLARVDYIILQQYSPSASAYSRVKLWLGGPSNLAASRPCLATTSNLGPGRQTACEDVGRASSSEEAASSMAPSDGRSEFHINPFEAEAARLEATGFFHPNAPEGSLLAAAKSADPGVRVRALQTLGLQNTKAGSQALNYALDDPDPFVRSAALDMLVSQGPGPESVGRLSDLLQHKDPAVRFPAAMALGEQPGAEAELQLKRALDNDDRAVQDMAARLLQQKEEQKENKDR
jgi:hypothetical protein